MHILASSFGTVQFRRQFNVFPAKTKSISGNFYPHFPGGRVGGSSFFIRLVTSLQSPFLIKFLKSPLILLALKPIF